jgi:hypothetical protein
MATSIFLAKLIGGFLLILGVGLLINRRGVRAIADDFLRSPGLLFLTGLVILPAGLAIVLTHNVWVASWPVLITILGWLCVVSGVIRLLAPPPLLDLGRRLHARPNVLTVSASVWVAIGAVLSYCGYVR